MPKRPKFDELPESVISTEVESVSDRDTRRKAPKGRQIREQSEESKYIKRTNEQLKSLYNYIPGTENNYIAPYKRAFKEAGIETTTKMVNGEEVLTIRNTKENRAKIDELRRTLAEENVKTMSDIRREASRDIRERGEKVTKWNVDRELEEKAAFAKLENNLDFVYHQIDKGNSSFEKYRRKLKGHSRTEEREYYNAAVVQIAHEVEALKEQERRKAFTESERSRVKPNNVY